MVFYKRNFYKIIMPKSGEKAANLPVLGCSRTAPYTHADFSKDLQVYHLTSKHHPNQLYDGISKNFMNSIEVQQDPSNTYNRNMKNLYMDQLDNSLNQYKDKMLKLNLENMDFRRQYKENVNGLILSMEKEDQRRQQSLNNRLRVQEERRNRFVDADLIKNKKIDDFIRCSDYNSNLEIARSQLLQERSKNLTTHKQQTQPNETYNQQQRSYAIKNFPNNDKPGEIYRQKETNSLYAGDSRFDKNISKPVDFQKSSSAQRVLRLHNPITNPIEYHVDNPYFINKMQRKYEPTLPNI